MCGGFTNAAEHKVLFNPDVLMQGLQAIFDGFDVKDGIQPDIFKETLRLFNLAAAKGISESHNEDAVTDEFLEQIRHNNEVFSAFRTHRMQNDIAAQLIDADGQLKSWDKFSRDVAPLTGKYCKTWLNTEYNTAVIRAHRAADWKHFEAEKDIYPNLRWMPTTSVTPDPVHEEFWRKKLTLPVDHPFWGKHHPGERWGCKCTCEQTDEPVNDLGLSEAPKDTASKGLKGNPGETGQLFSEDHPYYPKNCGGCPFNKRVKNRFKGFFNKRKDCSSCMACSDEIIKAKGQYSDEIGYTISSKYGERLKICKGADMSELVDNERCASSLLSSFPKMKITIRKHVLKHHIKNPEYWIDGLIADRKGIKSYNGISTAFNKAFKQECTSIVFDLDMYMKEIRINPHKIAKQIANRKETDFHSAAIKECYIVYHNKAIRLSCDQSMEEMEKVIEKLKLE